MPKTLVIVESPTKAKSLGKFLGSKYTVKASMGHVRDLPRSQIGINIEENFQPRYITIRGKGETIKELKAAVKKVDQVLLAPDPDREGEAIAWHLKYILGINSGPCRVEFNEVTKQAVQKAIKVPRAIDFDRVNSQQARRILDRLVGYNLSPLLWQKIRSGLSAGRVQSVAVRLICDREAEIQAFVPEEYWSLTNIFIQKKGITFEGRLVKIGDGKAQIPDSSQMDAILKELDGVSYQIAKINQQDKPRHPAPPFTTSTMQQEAYRKLNFTARRTMVAAQQLYEGLEVGERGPVGLVTYIRTDSTRVSKTSQDEVRAFIQEKFGRQYIPDVPRQIAARGKIQDAHEAIRPTSVYRDPDMVKKYLTQDQYKLYKLIWSRFVASQMSPAVIETTSADIAAGKFMFRATGSLIRFTGFMQVYTESLDEGPKEEEKALPELAEGDILDVKSKIPKQHFTQPLPRFTDASLIKTLEERGIGRPSTYAPIVDTIQKRGYVAKQKKQYVPTELGIIVVDLLKSYFSKIIDVEFTATIEEKLDKIEEGKLDWVQMIREFYHPFQETVRIAKEEVDRVTIPDEVTEEICEKCGRNMVIKAGRHGKFLACPGFPECRHTMPIVISTGVSCPQCEGDLIVRRSKKGRQFYGCSRFPECNFVVWDEPTNERCPQCGGLMVLKKNNRMGKAQLTCVNRDCRFKSDKDTAESIKKRN